MPVVLEAPPPTGGARPAVRTRQHPPVEKERLRIARGTAGPAARYHRAMPDDAPSPHPAPRPPTAAPGLPCARAVAARYLDLRGRGLTHEAALRDATALLWGLLPALSAWQAGEITAEIVGAADG
jgi:hypothetical protein